MNESDARKYIKNLVLRNKPKTLEIALEHYKTKFGHSFWGVKTSAKVPATEKEINDLFGSQAQIDRLSAS